MFLFGYQNIVGDSVENLVKVTLENRVKVALNNSHYSLFIHKSVLFTREGNWIGQV